MGKLLLNNNFEKMKMKTLYDRFRVDNINLILGLADVIRKHKLYKDNNDLHLERMVEDLSRAYRGCSTSIKPYLLEILIARPRNGD